MVNSANIITGHNSAGGAGIFIADPGTANNTVAGNLVGLGIFTTIPNNYGIYVTNSATGNQILANSISNSSNSGVAIVGTGTTGNAISDNQFFNNGGLGIDLGANGVTANDNLDGDKGPNNLQNFPTLSNVVIGSNSVTLKANINSQANAIYSVTLYRSSRCDASGYGEGEVKFGSIGISTDDSGKGAAAGLMYSVPNSLTQASWGTAIALASNDDTSEFGPCVGISDHIFGSGFDSAAAAAVAVAPAGAAPASTTEAVAGAPDMSIGIEGDLQALADHQWQLSLRIDNRSTHAVPAQIIGVTASAAVAVQDMQASVGTCALNGRIECRLPALASGEVVAILLRLGALQDLPFALTAQSETHGRPLLEREFKTTPDVRSE
jgi:hypothetical protein